MDLYLIRHADALALGERGVTEDEDRPLSDKGEGEAASLAKTLQKRGVTFDKLVASPLVRARQTAEIMLRTVGATHQDIVTCPDLVPNGRPRRLAKFLEKFGAEKVALVSHLPFIAEAAAWLIGSKKAQLHFAKAAVAHIVIGPEVGKGTGILEWLVTPDWFE